WISRVGALMLPITDSGLDLRSRSMDFGSALPLDAMLRYASQTSWANRPHCGLSTAFVCRPPPVSAPRPDPVPSVELPPEPKNRPAHCFLNTPSTGSPPTESGRNALARSFQVIDGTIASTRLSSPAS